MAAADGVLSGAAHRCRSFALGMLLPGLLTPLPAAAGSDSDGVASAAPYVPSPHSVVARMLELGGVGPDDYLIDLGSGDGRIVLTAAKLFGARGLGVEIREDLVTQSRRAARRQGVAGRARFERQDLFATDLSGATVVTLYLLPETLSRLRGKLLRELEPGTRVLSHDYPIEGWKAERFEQFEHDAKVAVTGVSRTNLFLYRMPADVHGTWTAAVPAALSDSPLRLQFVQRFNSVRGRALLDDSWVPLDGLTLSGRRLSFALPDDFARFTAALQPDGRLAGTVAVAGRDFPWQAQR